MSEIALRTFTGTERAAVLMMLVGEEEAAAILQKLEPDEVRELGRAMYTVADVSEADVEGVLDDFVGRARLHCDRQRLHGRLTARRPPIAAQKSTRTWSSLRTPVGARVAPASTSLRNRIARNR